MAEDEDLDEPTEGEPVSGAIGPERPTEPESERVTPEVVGDGPPPVPGPNDKVALYRMVRIGITMLMVVGALTAVLGITTLANPDDVVCAAARRNIADELDQDAPAEAVSGLDPDTVDDLPCEEAVPTAEQLDESLIDESAAKNLGIAATVLGLVMAGGGVYALVTRTRRGRTVALVAAGLGLVASMAQLGLGVISLIGLAFAIYGMVFSRDARASYGEPRGGRGGATGGAPRPSIFRPRLPPPSPKDE
jgi:hypothetical protein